MAVYNEVEGWQNKQFLGRGEFSLPFGNYKVSITVPADHIVAATGELKNPTSVLNKTQIKRWEKAKKNYTEPVIIVTEDEAVENEKKRVKTKKLGFLKLIMFVILAGQAQENLYGMLWL